MRQLKEGNSEIRVVDDKKGTPTYTYDFANQVKLLIQEELWGVYNCVCCGKTNRVDIVKAIVEILNMSNKIRVEQVPSTYFQTEYFAERPACECLINKKLNDKGVNIMRDWRVCLEEYVHKYYQEYYE